MRRENPREHAKSRVQRLARESPLSVRGRARRARKRGGGPGRGMARPPPPPQRWELVERSFCSDISYICLLALSLSSLSHSMHRVRSSNLVHVYAPFHEIPHGSMTRFRTIATSSRVQILRKALQNTCSALPGR